MSAPPVLSAIDLSRPRFKAGDRLIARVSTDLDAHQKTKLVRTIQKFANTEVRVWIINCAKTKVDLVRAGQRESLVSMLHVEPDTKMKGKMNLSLAAVDFMDYDLMEVTCRRMTQQQRHAYQMQLKDWTGKEVEIRIIEDSSLL